MDNLQKVKYEIEECGNTLHEYGYFPGYNNNITEQKYSNNQGTNIVIGIKETNIEGYFYTTVRVKKGTWKKEFKSIRKFLKSLDTDFEDDIRDGKIDSILSDEI